MNIASAHADENRRLDVPHRDIADVDVLADATVYHLYGNAGDYGRRGRDAFHLGGPVAEIVFTGTADGDVAHSNIAIAGGRAGAQFDGVAVGCGHTVGNRDILAQTVAGALKADGVVLAVENAVLHNHVLGFYVYSVVVVVAMGVNLDAAHTYAFAVGIVLHPVGRILQADILHHNVFAIPEKDNHGPSAGVGLSNVESIVSALAVDGAKAGNCYVLLKIGINQCRMRGFSAGFRINPMGLVVSVDIGHAKQFRPHLQVQLNAGFEFDGAGKELPCRHRDSATAQCTQLVDGFLDGGGVISSRFCLSAGLGYVDIPAP